VSGVSGVGEPGSSSVLLGVSKIDQIEANRKPSARSTSWD